MKNNKIKNYFVLTILFIPSLILLGEGICFGLIKIKNLATRRDLAINKNVKYPYTPDLITGGYRFSVKEKDLLLEEGFLDKHGLIKTIYSSNKNKDKGIKGILVTGNSVALGVPLTQFGEYQNSFINLLEKKLRLKDDLVDIVNLSFPESNSWQENLQIARYFNAAKNHSDLPENIELIASIGGVQDFWRFLDLLYLDKENFKEYYKASGLMSLRIDDFDQTSALYKNSFQSLNGNIKSSLQILIASIVNNFRNNSSIYRAFKFMNSLIEENVVSFNKENKNEEVNIEKLTLLQLIESKIDISQKEYETIKEMAIESVARNFQLMASFQQNRNVSFIYLPTRFSISKNQKRLEDRFQYISKSKKILNVYDLMLIERDYREALLNRLSSVDGIRVHNFALKGNEDWFFDESHFSKKGHKEIALEIFPLLYEAISSRQDK